MKFTEILDLEIDFVTLMMASWPMLSYNDRKNLTKHAPLRYPNLNKMITSMEARDEELTQQNSSHKTFIDFINEQKGLKESTLMKLKTRYMKHFTDVSITMSSFAEPSNFFEIRRNAYFAATEYFNTAITTCHDAYVDDIMSSDDTHDSKNFRIAALTNTFRLPHISDVESFEELLTVKPSKGDVPEIIIPFPWNGLNELIDEKGMVSGRLTLIMALRGVGKSCTSSQIAAQAALSGFKVMIFSMEMSKNQVRWRILAQVTRKTVPELRKMKDEERVPQDIIDIAKQLDKNIIIERPFSSHVSAVKQALDDYNRLHHELPSLVIYDYAQMATAGQVNNRAEDLTQISNTFSNYSIDYNLHFICLSQLTEEDQKNKTSASIGHATFGKGLEDAASHVIILKDMDINKKAMLLKKNRFGQKDVELELYWYGQSMMLYDDFTLPTDLRTLTESAIDSDIIHDEIDSDTDDGNIVDSNKEQDMAF